MNLANISVNKEGEDWSCAVATNHFKENSYKNIFSSDVLTELKDKTDLYEFYCESCIYNRQYDADYREQLTSGNEIINKKHIERMNEGKFLTCGCDNCV